MRLYLTDLEAARTETGAGLYQPVYQPATLARRLAGSPGIAAAHRDAGLRSPTRDPAVAAVLTGIRRARAHPPHRMRPLLLDDIKIVLAQMDGSRWPTGLSAARDSFVLLAGFVGALRRSELAALTIGDLTWHPADGLHLRMIWAEASSGADVFARLNRLPGFGKQKAQIFTALLGKQCGVAPEGWREAAGSYGDDGSRRSIADVVDPVTLSEVRDFKQAQKKAAKGPRRNSLSRWRRVARGAPEGVVPLAVELVAGDR